MKKILLIGSMVLMMLLPAPVKAGGVYDPAPIGSIMIGGRLGLSHTVGANLSVDYGFKQVWKGTFTLGAHVGYMWDARLSPLRTKYNHYHKFGFRARTTYRLNVVVPEWEVYAGAALGGSWTKYSEYVEKGHYVGSRGWVSGSFIMGTTYHFTDLLGLNLELNFGDTETAWVSMGVQVKL